MLNLIFHRTPFPRSHPYDHPNLIAFYDKQGVLTTSNPDPHGTLDMAEHFNFLVVMQSRFKIC